MRKPLVAMLALLLLPSIVTLPPRAATPPGPYAVTDLGVFDPKIQSAHGNDVNEGRQVVGYAGNRAFIWQDGALTALPTLGGTSGMARRSTNSARLTTIVNRAKSQSRRWMSGLLVGEIALSVVLLASAGLLIRSARALYAADQAIDMSNVVTARLSLPPGQYGTPQERIAE